MVLAWRVAGRWSLPLATRRAWRRLGVGLAGWFVANVGWLWYEALRGLETPVAFDVVYLAASGVMMGGLLLFAVAAESQLAHAAGEAAAEEPERPRRPLSVLPYLAVAGGYGLLLVVARGLPLYPLGGMLVGSVVMIALVVTRQLSVLRENARLTE